MSLHLPFTDPVLIVALAMVIFLVVPLLFERLRIPGIIGLIIAGAVVGPNGFGVLERNDTIELLGTVGLLYLMFQVGLELDLVDFNKYRNQSILFGSISFVIPQVVGTGLGLLLGYSWLSALLLGAVFASHTVLAYPIASRLGITKNLAVTTTLGGTILTEVLALLVLAVIAGAVGEGGIGPAFWATLLGSLAVYVAVVLWGVPRLGRWFFRKVANEGVAEFVFVMAVVFTVAYLAHAAHVEPIIGALLAGLALNRLIPHSGTLMNRINFVGGALFIPFFLLSVGMLVNVRALTTTRALTVAVSFAVAVSASKWISAKLTERASRYSPAEGWVVFGLSVPHASGTLAIVLVGFDIGLFDQTEVNGVVLTILVTCLLGPYVVERYGRQLALAEEQKPYEPSEAPQRILIPISNPATADALLDLAFLIRGAGSEEPLHPLMVVRDDPDGTEAQVAEAEKMLSHAVVYGAGADIPMMPLTRVDRNVATGIARGIAETRISTVIVGWDGGRSGTPGIFGGVLDQLLEQTRQRILVAKLGHPLNTTARIVLVLPPGCDHHPGFYGAIGMVKTIAGQLGASILALVVRDNAVVYGKHLEAVKPEVPMTLDEVGTWRALLPELENRLRADDLVVVLSARRGTVSWNRALERLPGDLAHLGPESFIMMYPGEVEGAPRRDTPMMLPAHGLTPQRVLLDLDSASLQGALETMIDAGFAGNGTPAALRERVRQAFRSNEAAATEALPGVLIPHSRIQGLTRPILVLGISRDGISVPGAAEPARLIFLLLSPAERPGDHLRALASIARLASNPARVEALIESRSVEDAVGAMGAGRGGV